MTKEHADRYAICVENLVKVYRGAESAAVDDLSLRIPYGQIFGLLGPNGAGKTTLISVLCTLLRPTDGSATVCGLDVVRKAADIRKLIGLVPQDIALYQTLTARENLRYFARMLRVQKQRIEARVEACLSMVGLEAFGDRRVDTFSGGMKRRVNLAVAVLHEPKVLFLDEPTVGIDAQSRNLIVDRLGELNEAGMTLIYTSHYMEEVQTLCAEIAVIDRGRVIASGTPQALIAEHDDCNNLDQLFLALTGKQLRD